MLNQTLYDKMVRVLGEVRVSNPGSRSILQDRVTWKNEKARRSTWVASPGEHYNVNCPFCSDQEKRLSIHYLYGQRDPANGFLRTRIAICFKEDCLSKPSNQKRLAELLAPSNQDPRLPKPRLGSGKAAQIVLPTPKIAMPSGLVPIYSDDAASAAIYMEERGFDVSELWRLWRVQYCEVCEDSNPPIYERIVYPFYRFSQPKTAKQPVELCGWQARKVWNRSQAPKYLTATGFEKSAHLYGLTWAAKHKGPLIVCEGVTDVWRLKTNAVAMFGKTLSARQVELLKRVPSDRRIALFLDADAQDNMEKNARLLRDSTGPSRAKQVALVELPRGRKDPGECTYDEAWDAVAKALKLPVKKLGLAENLKMKVDHA